ncbi:hypothetical protein FA13DRAFT_1719699 [Coprinellus micaceus]|uniref:Uncharacterized protein n=1 Tax=Coprinellus micaceus TaxID=71717 RepID=A0A4Y7SCK6_COPMI|nr:hypothetical protein FA13DRAFT_1719699 [Coprinellus micaceus]
MTEATEVGEATTPRAKRAQTRAERPPVDKPPRRSKRQRGATVAPGPLALPVQEGDASATLPTLSLPNPPIIPAPAPLANSAQKPEQPTPDDIFSSKEDNSNGFGDRNFFEDVDYEEEEKHFGEMEFDKDQLSLFGSRGRCHESPPDEYDMQDDGEHGDVPDDRSFTLESPSPRISPSPSPASPPSGSLTDSGGGYSDEESPVRGDRCGRIKACDKAKMESTFHCIDDEFRTLSEKVHRTERNLRSRYMSRYSSKKTDDNGWNTYQMLYSQGVVAPEESADGDEPMLCRASYLAFCAKNPQHKELLDSYLEAHFVENQEASTVHQRKKHFQEHQEAIQTLVRRGHKVHGFETVVLSVGNLVNTDGGFHFSMETEGVEGSLQYLSSLGPISHNTLIGILRTQAFNSELKRILELLKSFINDNHPELITPLAPGALSQHHINDSDVLGLLDLLRRHMPDLFPSASGSAVSLALTSTSAAAPLASTSTSTASTLASTLTSKTAAPLASASTTQLASTAKSVAPSPSPPPGPAQTDAARKEDDRSIVTNRLADEVERHGYTLSRTNLQFKSMLANMEKFNLVIHGWSEGSHMPVLEDPTCPDKPSKSRTGIRGALGMEGLRRLARVCHEDAKERLRLERGPGTDILKKGLAPIIIGEKPEDPSLGRRVCFATGTCSRQAVTPPPAPQRPPSKNPTSTSAKPPSKVLSTSAKPSSMMASTSAKPLSFTKAPPSSKPRSLGKPSFSANTPPSANLISAKLAPSAKPPSSHAPPAESSKAKHSRPPSSYQRDSKRAKHAHPSSSEDSEDSDASSPPPPAQNPGDDSTPRANESGKEHPCPRPRPRPILAPTRNPAKPAFPGLPAGRGPASFKDPSCTPFPFVSSSSSGTSAPMRPPSVDIFDLSNRRRPRRSDAMDVDSTNLQLAVDGGFTPSVARAPTPLHQDSAVRTTALIHSPQPVSFPDFPSLQIQTLEPPRSSVTPTPSMGSGFSSVPSPGPSIHSFTPIPPQPFDFNHQQSSTSQSFHHGVQSFGQGPGDTFSGFDVSSFAAGPSSGHPMPPSQHINYPAQGWTNPLSNVGPGSSQWGTLPTQGSASVTGDEMQEWKQFQEWKRFKMAGK